MKIALELFSSLKIVDNIAVYTGGMLYVKQRIRKIKTFCSKSSMFNFVLLVPNSFEPIDEDKMLYADIDKIYSKSLYDVDLSNIDVLFMPQVDGSSLLKIPRIKKTFPNLKIFATLHDRRHNVTKFDFSMPFYYNGLKHSTIFQYALYLIKKIAFDIS